jgi:hypothetical protein
VVPGFQEMIMKKYMKPRSKNGKKELISDLKKVIISD